ncbi:MAG: hypothetical protein NTX48_08610 [Planctomycetales bacterium]|nr:hypothetical protein [Planctomycetales bacterium]
MDSDSKEHDDMKSPALLLFRATCFVVALPIFFVNVQAQLVPGTGMKLQQVGDDFEDEKWEWVPNGNKASKEQDEQVRTPTGFSNNQRWFESPKRGMPDHILRVETPLGGIAGSKGSLKIQTLNSGVPGQNSGQMEQDDLVMSCTSRIGAIAVSRSPSCTCRIFLPPFDKWENRSGTHFGYRIDTKTTITESKKRFLFSKSSKKQEEYWPGYFIEFHSSHDGRTAADEAILLIRGDHLGHEVKSLKLAPGWWTLGMSVSGDGQVHFYGKQGVKDLTSADHLYSSFPYGYKAEYFATHFFNSCNLNDGKTWSTPIIIDDPAIFSMR